MKNEYLMLAGGALGVVAATSLSFVYDSLWVGFFSALAAAVLILILMSWKMLGEIRSSGIKKTITYLFAVLAIAHVFNSVFEWVKSENKHQILTELRQVIDGSIAQIEAEQVLIESLRYRYQQKEVVNLEEAFRSVAGDRLTGDGSLLPKEEKNAKGLNFQAEIAGPDSILIHIVADVAKGNDPEFENYDGQSGKYEGLGILTPKGVRYVRQN